MLKKITFDIQKCTRDYLSDENMFEGLREILAWFYFVK